MPGGFFFGYTAIGNPRDGQSSATEERWIHARNRSEARLLLIHRNEEAVSKDGLCIAIRRSQRCGAFEVRPKPCDHSPLCIDSRAPYSGGTS